MAIGSGLAAQFGLASESTYGTGVAVTRFHEFDKESLGKQKVTVQGGGLSAGRIMQLGTRRVITSTAAAGSIDMEVHNKGLGLMLTHLMGGTPTIAQQGATAAWLQTFAFGDNIGKSFTAQVGVPDATGTVRPYTYQGGKVLSASFSCGAQTLLTSSWDMDFQSVTEATGIATASYTATAPRHGGEMNVKIGSFGAEASITGVTKVDCKIERSQNTDRYYASATTPSTKAEPIWNDFLKVTGSIEQQLTDKTTLADRFASDASTSLILEWVGPIIASTFKETFRIKLPMVFLDTGTPDVENTDITATTYNFTAQYDGTNNPCTIEYMSTDVAI